MEAPFWNNALAPLPREENLDCINMTDIITSEEGLWDLVVLSNFMTDVDWLFGICDTLKRVPTVVLLSGDGAVPLRNYLNLKVHKPRLPISYGTHHSKAVLCFNQTGCRIAIHTSNYIISDWDRKSQGIWVQDFPRATSASSHTTEFSEYLQGYFRVVGGPWDPIRVLSQYDFTNATVDLIASVPGYHQGCEMKKWGMCRLHSLLPKIASPAPERRLLCQFSSLGSLDTKWVSEFSQGIRDIELVFPSVDEVRESFEGWRSGVSIPVPNKNHKPFLKPLLRKWSEKDVSHRRCRAMPHIKSYVCYHATTHEADWVCITSSNLSKAAWGQVQLSGTQLMVRSYELGVLYTPARLSATLSSWSGFSCSPKSPLRLPASFPFGHRVRFAGAAASLSLPYPLNPSKYAATDEPWSNDIARRQLDALGLPYPSPCEFYGPEGWMAPTLDFLNAAPMTSERKRHRKEEDCIVIE